MVVASCMLVSRPIVAPAELHAALDRFEAVSRICRLTLLAPDIVESILDGRQPRTLQLAGLMDDMPVEWDRQREMFGVSAR